MTGVFLPTLSATAIMLLVAVPGYILMKRKMVGEDSPTTLSKILLFVCQPCLAVYTFKSSEYSTEKLINVGIFALMVLLVHAIMLSATYLVLRKKSGEVIYRIITISTTFSNCAFFGIPIIEAVLPAVASELIIYTTVFAVVMNIVGWTVGSAIISHDTKYISLKKVFFNPATIGLAVALLLYIARIDLPTPAMSMVSSVARMATPLSMLIMGMRLADVDLASMFKSARVYFTLVIKQFVMPILVFLLLIATPSLDVDMRRALFIMCACPVASVVLNFAEIVGEGQREAANIVLLSTMTSIISLPIVMLLLPYIA